MLSTNYENLFLARGRFTQKHFCQKPFENEKKCCGTKFETGHRFVRTRKIGGTSSVFIILQRQILKTEF